MNLLTKYKGLLYLIVVVIIAPWLAWRMAITDTVKMSRQAVRFEKEAAALRAKAGQAKVGLSSVVQNRGELQSGGMIPSIMGEDARCRVVKYTPYITESRDGFVVHTAELVVSGTYADLLGLMYKTEQGEGYRLVSTSFRAIRQRQKKDTQLQLTMILQQITRTI